MPLYFMFWPTMPMDFTLLHILLHCAQDLDCYPYVSHDVFRGYCNMFIPVSFSQLSMLPVVSFLVNVPPFQACVLGVVMSYLDWGLVNLNNAQPKTYRCQGPAPLIVPPVSGSV